MRFILAFVILCFAKDPADVGWALFLCLWKIADMLDDLRKLQQKQIGVANNVSGGNDPPQPVGKQCKQLYLP